MATTLQLGIGQLTMREVADKLNTAVDLESLRARLGGASASQPDIFPDEWNGYIYQRFQGSPPYECTSSAQLVSVNILCYGTPVFETDESWITPPASPGEINGQTFVNFSVQANAGSARSGVIRMRVVGALQDYVVDTTIEQEAPISTQAVSLGFDTTSGDPDACSDFVFNPSTYYLKSTETFDTATVIYGTSDGSKKAGAGWYSDGSIARYWTGAIFTSQENCTI